MNEAARDGDLGGVEQLISQLYEMTPGGRGQAVTIRQGIAQIDALGRTAAEVAMHRSCLGKILRLIRSSNQGSPERGHQRGAAIETHRKRNRVDGEAAADREAARLRTAGGKLPDSPPGSLCSCSCVRVGKAAVSSRRKFCLL